MPQRMEADSTHSSAVQDGKEPAFVEIIGIDGSSLWRAEDELLLCNGRVHCPVHFQFVHGALCNVDYSDAVLGLWRSDVALIECSACTE